MQSGSCGEVIGEDGDSLGGANGGEEREGVGGSEEGNGEVHGCGVDGFSGKEGGESVVVC